MSNKVFISILGTGNYNKCKYFFDNPDVHLETRYAQLATLQLLYNNWSNDDKVLIFTTPQAKEKHYDLLEDEFKQLNKESELIRVDIDKGLNPGSQWDIFEKILENIPPESELYIDITHSFRYLPMLVLVLANYAKALKNIEIGKITYGNWEARNENNNTAPITDLTSLSYVQDWAVAVNDFTEFGNVKKLQALASKTLKPLLSKSANDDKSANHLENAIISLEQLTEEIQTCRLQSIYEGSKATEVIISLNKVNNVDSKPLAPLIGMMSEKTQELSEENNLDNGFKAVEWCIDNGMLQQGYTILQENIINYLCVETKVGLTNREFREDYSAALNIISGKNKTPISKNMQNLKNVDSIEMLAKEYRNIANIRNDINHAGMRKNACGAKKFKPTLQKSLGKIKDIIYAGKPD
ncbi:MAG: TIGR02221 family CRISPR-associated protein [Bacteroidales bacterium]|nr:TIGR02221 family CRISPR-associated protein [Bacteroidales bacterium]